MWLAPTVPPGCRLVTRLPKGSRSRRSRADLIMPKLCSQERAVPFLDKVSAVKGENALFALTLTSESNTQTLARLASSGLDPVLPSWHGVCPTSCWRLSPKTGVHVGSAEVAEYWYTMSQRCSTGRELGTVEVIWKKWTQRSAQRNLVEMIQALWKSYVIQAIVISLKLKETKVLQKVVRPLHHYQPEPWIHSLASECCIRNWDSLVRVIFPGLLWSSLVKPVSTDRMVFCKISCLVLLWDGLLQTLAVASGDSICNLGFIFLSLTQFIVSFRGPDC